jgi:hypothetical protein
MYVCMYVCMCACVILYDVLTVHWPRAERTEGKEQMNWKDEWRPIMKLEQHEREVTAREVAQVESNLLCKGVTIFWQ